MLRPQAPARVRRAASALARFAALCAGLVLALTLARAVLADQYHVPTSSMWPTIAPGDRIFVDKLAYGLRVPFTDRWLIARAAPRPGDVVVFADPRGGRIPLVKRVVAVAGQTVAVRRGVLLVDGAPQEIEVLGDGQLIERLAGVAHAAGSLDLEAFGPVVVPFEHVFVMGDNRAASLDSRDMGAIPRRLLRGRVLGLLHHGNGAGLDPGRLLHAIDARPEYHARP
jgi:signal peptidase I